MSTLCLREYLAMLLSNRLARSATFTLASINYSRRCFQYQISCNYMSSMYTVVARLEPLIVRGSEGQQVTGTLHCSRTLLKISMNRLFQKFTSQMLWPLARMNYNCITKSWFMALDRHNLLWSQHFKTHITGRIWLPYYSDNQ